MSFRTYEERFRTFDEVDGLVLDPVLDAQCSIIICWPHMPLMPLWLVRGAQARGAALRARHARLSRGDDAGARRASAARREVRNRAEERRMDELADYRANNTASRGRNLTTTHDRERRRPLQRRARPWNSYGRDITTWGFNDTWINFIRAGSDPETSTESYDSSQSGSCDTETSGTLQSYTIHVTCVA